MLEGDNISVREVHGLSEGELQKIKAFLQGAVYCWCAIRKSDWFCARDLLGGVNQDWKGYPLKVLYFRYLIAPPRKIRSMTGDLPSLFS